MEFKSIKGVSGDYIELSIEGGCSQDCIGDQVWFSGDGKGMEIHRYVDEDIINEVKELFSGNSKRAFIGAMIRMDVL